LHPWHSGEAGKLPVQIGQVNSGMALQRCKRFNWVAAVMATSLMVESAEAIISSLSPGDARFCFLVKKNFGCDEK
jgi:hypothetical protein